MSSRYSGRHPKVRPGASGKDCSECGKPILVTPGTRHASCSPRCRVCYDPVLSTDPTNEPRVHAGCANKRPKDEETDHQ